MPMSRLAAGMPETSLPSTSTSPVSAVSNPATIRSAVVLPQPDGPSSATSSPGAISSDIPSSALDAPKARVSSRSDTLVPSRAPAAGPPAATAGRADRSGRGGYLVRCHQLSPIVLVFAVTENRLTSPAPVRRPRRLPIVTISIRNSQVTTSAMIEAETEMFAFELVGLDDPDRERGDQVEAGHRELAQAERDDQHGRREQRGAQVRQDHPPHRGQPAAPEVARRLGQRLQVDRAQPRVDRPVGERHRQDDVLDAEQPHGRLELNREDLEDADREHDRRDHDRQDRDRLKEPAHGGQPQVHVDRGRHHQRHRDGPGHGRDLDRGPERGPEPRLGEHRAEGLDAGEPDRRVQREQEVDAGDEQDHPPPDRELPARHRDPDSDGVGASDHPVAYSIAATSPPSAGA